MSDKYVIYYLRTCRCVVVWSGQCHFWLCGWQSLKQSVWTDDRVTGVDRDISISVPLELFAKTLETNMFDRRCADMFGHVCLFGSGGPLACLVMFKQTCWELWSLLHMAHWHVYILFDSLTCTMTCQVKQMIGIVSWAKVPWQKLQTKVMSTSCFEMSWWGSLEAK